MLPAVPVRQWVLSLPFELRALAAFRADVLSAVGRIFVEAIFARQRSWAKRQRLGGEAPCGAVTFVQRFGSSVNLNVHFHVVVLDGAFSRDDQGRARFHPAPPPTREELEDVVRRVRRRVVAWLARKRRLDGPAAEEHSGGTTQTPLDACAAIAMQRGSTRALREDGHAPEQERIPEPPPNLGAVEHDAFNLHASVAVAADDDFGRERLCRYGARPPLALERLRRQPDGRVAYRIKAQRDGRAKYRVMTPLEFLARLAALVPPPRYPLVRFHGVLAPRSSWRRDVVPRPRAPIACAPARRSRPAAAHCSARATKPAPEAFANAASSWATAPTSPSAGRRSTKTTRPRAELERPVGAASVEHQADAADCSPPPGAPIVLAPNVLAVEHWNRLFGGLLYAATPRLDWAALLRRSFEVDVLACKQCGGRLRVLGAVTDPAMVRLMLESLGMPTEAPRAARARDPTELLGNPEADR